MIHGAFICARYSTDHQNPDSIAVQVSKCSEYCRKHNLPILGIYADEATSGMKETRPEYERMMQDLRSGMADTVVIYDQSRAFRKMTAWFQFREELQALGVTVISVTQPIIGQDLNDPMVFLNEGTTALFSQIWALQTRQKVVEKMRFMAKNGQYTGGKPALGYQIVDGKLEICEEEAAIVRRIFRDYAGGKSYKHIIDDLNAEGLKTKRGNPFGSNSLHDLMKNEKYIGVLTYGAHPVRGRSRNIHAPAHEDTIRIEDAIPAIIDKETFQAVQERMTTNRRIQNGRPSERNYPLKGKVFCGKCKSALYIRTSKGNYNYYNCCTKKRSGQCDMKPIAVPKLEDLVAQAVKETLGKPSCAEKIMSEIRKRKPDLQQNAAPQLKVYIAREKELKRQLDNAVEAILNGLSSQTIKDKITQLEAEIAENAKRMTKLHQAVQASEMPEKELYNLLDYLCTNDLPQEIYLKIVARVEVYNDKIKVWLLTRPTDDPDWDDPGVIITFGDGFAVPKKNNPNLFSVGDGFGLFVFLGEFEEAHCRNGVAK